MDGITAPPGQDVLGLPHTADSKHLRLRQMHCPDPQIGASILTALFGQHRSGRHQVSATDPIRTHSHRGVICTRDHRSRVREMTRGAHSVEVALLQRHHPARSIQHIRDPSLLDSDVTNGGAQHRRHVVLQRQGPHPGGVRHAPTGMRRPTMDDDLHT